MLEKKKNLSAAIYDTTYMRPSPFDDGTGFIYALAIRETARDNAIMLGSHLRVTRSRVTRYTRDSYVLIQMAGTE